MKLMQMQIEARRRPTPGPLEFKLPPWWPALIVFANGLTFAVLSGNLPREARLVLALLQLGLFAIAIAVLLRGIIRQQQGSSVAELSQTHT